MKNVYEVLRQKERDLARVRHEVEALRSVAPMLTERNDQPTSRLEPVGMSANSFNRWPLKVEDNPPTYAES